MIKVLTAELYDLSSMPENYRMEAWYLFLLFYYNLHRCMVTHHSYAPTYTYKYTQAYKTDKNVNENMSQRHNKNLGFEEYITL